MFPVCRSRVDGPGAVPRRRQRYRRLSGRLHVALIPHRYAIANYTIQSGEAGYLVISDSFLRRGSTDTTPPRSGHGLGIYVNDALIRDTTYPIDATIYHGFNTLLGKVGQGDVITVAAGPHTNSYNDSFSLDFSLRTISVACLAAVAGYQSDFTPTNFPAGWAYMWNDSGPIGDPSNYANMTWNNANRYTTDGGDPLPRPDPGAYCCLNGNSGHPGRGSDHASTTNNHYAIAAYTIQRDGEYLITDSSIDTGDDQGNGGKEYP